MRTPKSFNDEWTSGRRQLANRLQQLSIQNHKESFNSFSSKCECRRWPVWKLLRSYPWLSRTAKSTSLTRAIASIAIPGAKYNFAIKKKISKSNQGFTYLSKTCINELCLSQCLSSPARDNRNTVPLRAGRWEALRVSVNTFTSKTRRSELWFSFVPSV